jgi:uncharacterized protein YrrD
MLRSTKDLYRYAINATDGVIGHVEDLFFDDDAWAVRYLVVEAGSWLDSRKVLVSPIAIHDPNWSERTLPVSMTKQQVKDSPTIDAYGPVSRLKEEQYADYYDYPYYWGGAGLWGDGLYPYALFAGYDGEGGRGSGRVERAQGDRAYLQADRLRQRKHDPCLRSCRAVTGDKLSASDGEIGTVAGYLVDDETWAIGYLIVETGHWWAGHQVLIAPQWISGIDWAAETVSVEMSFAEVQGAPPYDPNMPWSRLLDTSLYQHYGRTGYWSGRPGQGVER